MLHFNSQVAGIQSCVHAALKEYRCSGKLTVIGGGHSSNCFVDSALVIDMGSWNHVTVDHSTKTVVAGGGSTIGEITEAAQKHGLMVPLGDRPGVGMGLVLQGGINHMMRSCGLATDNLLHVLYVSPQAELCLAKTDEDLWPFRGAGSNFGVVLEVKMRAFAIATIVAADSEYCLGETCDSRVLSSYGTISATLPRSVAVDGYLFWGDVERMHFATSLFGATGARSTYKAVETVSTGMASAIGEPIESTPPTAFVPSSLFDREFYMRSSFCAKNETAPAVAEQQKIRSVKQCFFIDKLTPEVSHAIVEAMRRAPTKLCYVHFLHGGGKVTDPPSSFCAFGCRDWMFAAVFTGRYEEPAEAKNVTHWLQDSTQMLLKLSKGVYGADLGPSDARLAKFAFGENALRLARMKRIRDPSNILSCSCPLTGSSVSDDLRVRDRGVVIILCGRRFAGKDWLAETAAEALRSLLVHANGTGPSIAVRRISDATIRAFAKVTGGVEADKLIHDRSTKEVWRRRLTEYYEEQKERNPAYDRGCFVEAIEDTNADVLFLTGMRDGIDYARRLAGRAVVLVHVTSPNESKSSRGWGGTDSIDDSPSERSAEALDPSVFDLVYNNDATSDAESASTWVKTTLAPTILKLCVRSHDNFPRPGVVYRDIIGGILPQPFGLPLCVALTLERLRERDMLKEIDALIAPEASSYVFAGAIAVALQKPVLLAQKSHRAPGDVDCVAFDGSNITNLTKKGGSSEEMACFCLAAGSILSGQRILVVDDCLASGATLECLIRLVVAQGGRPTSLACLMELPDAGGRALAESHEVEVLSLFQFQGS